MKVKTKPYEVPTQACEFIISNNEKFKIHPVLKKFIDKHFNFDTTPLGYMTKITKPKDNGSYYFKQDFEAKLMDRIGCSEIKRYNDEGKEKPDIICEHEGNTYWFEIEKSKKESILFDFVKLLRHLSKEKQKHFGIIIAPRLYPPANGKQNLFNETEDYKGNLLDLGVLPELLEKIAIVGYETKVRCDSEFKYYDKKSRSELEAKAEAYFNLQK